MMSIRDLVVGVSVAASILAIATGCGKSESVPDKPTSTPTLAAAPTPIATLDQIATENSLYRRAIDDPTLQKEWVTKVLEKYGIGSLFGKIIIVTPENAHLYQDKYNRAKRVTGYEGNTVIDVFVATAFAAKLDIENFGTARAPLPELYVFSEGFRESEGNLEALIGLNGGNHAWVLRNGFEFGGIKTFELKNQPNVYSPSMLRAVYELEGIKEGLEKGSNIMTDKAIGYNKHIYTSLYVQLWGYGEGIKDEVNEMLRVRYFQPWMRNANSVWVSEDPDKTIKYGGKLDAPFLVFEGEQGYVQFGFRNSETPNVRLPLPASIRPASIH